MINFNDEIFLKIKVWADGEMRSPALVEKIQLKLQWLMFEYDPLRRILVFIFQCDPHT